MLAVYKLCNSERIAKFVIFFCHNKEAVLAAVHCIEFNHTYIENSFMILHGIQKGIRLQLLEQLLHTIKPLNDHKYKFSPFKITSVFSTNFLTQVRV